MSIATFFVVAFYEQCSIFFKLLTKINVITRVDTGVI